MITTGPNIFNRRTGGFTLVELILCMVMLAVGTFGIMSVFYSAGRGAMLMDRMVMATDLAREKLELVTGDKFNGGYVAIDAADYPDETFSGPWRMFTRKTTITEVSPLDLVTESPGSGFKRVTVTVTWGGDSAERVSIPVILTDY